MLNGINKALNWRYATKIFDSGKAVTEENLQAILEAGRLSPSSFGVEPWKFIVVENKELRTKLREASYDQPKVTDASHIIVIAHRTDIRENIARELIERTAKAQNVSVESLAGFQQMVEGAISARTDVEVLSWAKAQTYIPLGIMMETAALLDIDSCPMEGFDSKKVDELLGLGDKNLSSATMLAIGYRGEDSAAERPKVRRSFEEAVEFIN